MSRSELRIPRWTSTALLAAALALIVWLVVRDRRSLDAIGDVDPVDLLVILTLQALYLLPESYRQQIVVESSAESTIRWFDWFRIFIVGRFLNSLIPQSGNVYRALRLRSDAGIAVTDFGGGMAAFVVMSAAASLFAAAALVAWQSPELEVGGVPASWMLVVAGVVIVGAPFAVSAVMERWRSSHGYSTRILDTAHRVTSAMMTSLRDLRLMVVFLSVWIVTLMIVVALYRAVFESIGFDLAVGAAIAIYALLQASSFLVLTPGNLGIQELGFAALATVFGIPAASGVIAAGVIRVTGWIVVAIPALVFGSSEITGALRTRRRTR